MDEMQQIEMLISSAARLAVVETREPERIIEWLRDQVGKTGRAAYQWTARNGLQRIAIEHIPIPHTFRPLDVLDHIIASQHFGIYALSDFQTALQDKRVADKLNLIANGSGSAHKLVLLLGPVFWLPQTLTPATERIILT